MISASKEFKEKLKKGASCVNYADITLSNGTVLHLEPKDFMIGGCSIDDKTTEGKFGVGFVIGKTLSMRIANHDERFSQYDFYNSIITPYIALLLDDGTIEKIRKGVYYATVPSTPGDTIEISAVDGMYKLDKDYSASATVYPATLQTIISDACLDCGIPIGFTTFDNMGYIVQEKPEGVTYRQVVSYAAQIAGYNARINNDGYMQLIWYNTNLLGVYNYVGGDFKIYPHDTVIDGGDFTNYNVVTVLSGGNFSDMPEHIFRIKTLYVHTDDVQITGVRVVGEDNVTALFGEEGYVIEVKSNPFVYGHEQEIASYLGNRIVGMVFRPFTAQILNNPLYEPFEAIRLSDRKGNTYLSIINSVSYTIGSYTQIACEAEDPVRNGSNYFSEAAAAVAEARRNAKKQLTTYDKAVQNMNQLAANSLGYHTTYEDQSDGSRITYLHDKQTLAESTVIYKQTIDGFFISTDGGKSYTSGFDSQGNAVVNILYAIGIVCDWIKGGTLTLGGLSNEHGILVVLDENGVEKARWDESGINATGSFTTTGANKWTSGKTKTVLDDGTIKFYEQDVLKLAFSLVNFGNKDSNGEYLENRIAQTISTSWLGLCLGFISDDSSQSNTYYILNNGLNPNGLEERHLFNELVRFLKTPRMPGLHLMPSNTAKDESEFVKLYESSYDGQPSVMSSGGFYSYGSMGCSGTKYRVVDTDHYGKVGMNAFETTEAYFSDVGSGVISENGEITIFFDPVFAETVDLSAEYQVFLQRTSQKQTEWVEKGNGYFVVHGETGATFDWMLCCKQKDYTAVRMENVSIDYADKPEEITEWSD